LSVFRAEVVLTQSRPAKPLLQLPASGPIVDNPMFKPAHRIAGSDWQDPDNEDSVFSGTDFSRTILRGLE
jgi:hypothetical protein